MESFCYCFALPNFVVDFINLIVTAVFVLFTEQTIGEDVKKGIAYVDRLNHLYCRLAHEARTDLNGTLKQKIQKVNRQWKQLSEGSDAIRRRLSHMISVKDDFDASRLALIGWLCGIHDVLMKIQSSKRGPCTDVLKVEFEVVFFSFFVKSKFLVYVGSHQSS